MLTLREPSRCPSPTARQAGRAALVHRAKLAMKQEIAFIPNVQFAALGARETFLEAICRYDQQPLPGAGASSLAAGKVPGGYLRVGSGELLTAKQESDLFFLLNYLKYRANSLRAAIDPRRPNAAELDLFDRLLAQAVAARDRLVEANLRLVLSIAKQFSEAKFCFDDLVSEGLHTLLKAVEKFDFGRGYRLSTYATHAIRRNIYRLLMQRKKEHAQHEMASAEDFADRTDEREAPAVVEARWEKLRSDLARLMDRLDNREKLIIRARFGLGRKSEPKTLQSLAADLGVCKERVRQLEKRALDKLRKMADDLCIEDPQS